MEIVLLLLGLGLVLAEPSENIMEIITETFSQEEMQHAMVKRGQAKLTADEVMNSTLADKNISPSISEAASPASCLLPRSLCSTNPKGNIERCGNDMMAWRGVLEVNESCRLSSEFIHGSKEVIRRIQKSLSWKCGQKPSISCCETPERERPVCETAASKQFPRCQCPSMTSLKRMLTVLTSHSLMSWLVSGSKL